MPAIDEQVTQQDILALTKKKTQRQIEEPIQDAEPTAQELQEIEEFKKKVPEFLWGAEPKKEGVKKEEVKPEVKAVVKVEEKKEEEDKKVRKQKSTVDLEVAEAIGKQIGQQLSNSMKAGKEEKAPEDPHADLSEDDRYNMDVFTEMAESNPKYKDHPKKFSEFIKKEEEYRRAWMKNNQGEAYDSEDKTHEDFYDKNQPDYSERDFEEAKIMRAAKKLMSERDKTITSQMDELAGRALAPELKQQSEKMFASTIPDFVANLEDEENAKLLKDKGVDAVKEADPIAFEVYDGNAKRLHQFIGELHQIANRKAYFNGSNPVHSEIADFVDEKESHIKSLPIQKQMFGGKVFATRHEFAAMPDKDRASHWTLQENDIVTMATVHFATQAKQELKAFREKMEKYGYKKNAVVAKEQKQEGEQDPEPAAKTVVKVESPSGTDGGTVPPPGVETKKPAANEFTALMKSLF